LNEGTSGGGSKIVMNAPDIAPHSFEDESELLNADVPVDIPEVPANLDGLGAFLTDPHGGTAGASSLAQARGSGAIPKAARFAADAVGHLASATHQSPSQGEKVPISFSLTPGAERPDAASHIERLSASATRCVTVRKRGMERSWVDPVGLRESSGADVNDFLMFSPSQQIEEDDGGEVDGLRRSIF
jgi:hypothetical protein